MVRPLLVFDLDGVLVDVTGSFRVAIARTVAALGGGAVRSGEVEALKHAGGFNNDWDVTRELLRRRGIPVARARVIEVFSQIYRGTAAAPGLIANERWLLSPAALAQLQAAFTLAIFTGRPRVDAEFTLRHFQVASAFAAIVALEDAAAKPAPDGLAALAQRFAPAKLAAYLGDTIDDAHCAAAAGVPFVGICPPASALEALFAAAGARCTRPTAFAATDWLLRTADRRPVCLPGVL